MSQHDDNNEDDDIYEDDGSLPEDVMDPREKPMGFFDHLEELRWVVVKCAVVYVGFAMLIGGFIKQANTILLMPFNMARGRLPELPENLRMINVMDSFSAVMQLCFLGALIPAMPFFFFFAGQFIAPALTKKEKHMVIPVSLASLLLFVAGSLFSFFALVPSTLIMSAVAGDWLSAIPEWTIASYYGTLTWLTVGVGLSFEFPLVIVLLVYLGILRVETLRKYRRHAIVVIFIIAAIVTPTFDPITQTMFAGPLYLLFETAIFVGGRVQKKRDEAARAA